MDQHNHEILEAALMGFQHQKAAIDLKIQAIRAQLAGSPKTEAGAPAGAAKKKRRKLSAETRARMAEAQQKRWAATKKANKN